MADSPYKRRRKPKPSPELADALSNGALPELQAEPGKFGDLREELRSLCQNNLYFLVKGVLAPFTPGYDPETVSPGFHARMAEFCGNPPSRFTLLLAFRGSRKSTFGTVGYSVQQMLKGPQSVLIFSEAAMMAEKWSAEARLPFEGDNRLMTWLFPELCNKGRKWGDALWQLPHGGSVQAAGLDTQLMGAHVDHLIMDDVFSDAKGDKTPEFAERTLQWVKMSRPLLKNAATGFRRLTGVPWWLEGEPYAHFRKAIPAGSRFELPLIDEEGVCIWPEAYSPEAIDELRADPFVFSSQYLLSPVSQETAIFKRGIIHLYDDKPSDRNYTRIMAYDPAFSKERRSHHNAYAIGERDAKGNVWIEFAEKRKLDSHQAKRWCIEQALRHKPRFLGLECNGPQKVFYEEVKREMNRYPLHHPIRSIALVELKPQKDKVARWQALASGCANGQVRVKRGLSGLITELYRVTGAKHEENDMTDAAAHLVGAELAGKKPMKFSDQSDQVYLPWALRDDEMRGDRPSSYMAM